MSTVGDRARRREKWSIDVQFNSLLVLWRSGQGRLLSLCICPSPRWARLQHNQKRNKQVSLYCVNSSRMPLDCTARKHTIHNMDDRIKAGTHWLNTQVLKKNKKSNVIDEMLQASKMNKFTEANSAERKIVYMSIICIGLTFVSSNGARLDRCKTRNAVEWSMPGVFLPSSLSTSACSFIINRSLSVTRVSAWNYNIH